MTEIAERVPTLPAKSRAADVGLAVERTDGHDDEMTRPRAPYLRHLILTLMGDGNTPPEVRNECHNLMRAINANNLPEIVDRLAGLRRLAQTMGIQLPRPGTEPPLHY